MPVIILEGPDESGKTTLANKLHLAYDRLPMEVEIQRSPVKELGWKPEYNSYIDNAAGIRGDHLLIQDRSPEISEAIYGFVRGTERSDGWLVSLAAWVHHDIFLIFCEGPSSLNNVHTDAAGLVLNNAIHENICQLYDFTEAQIESYLDVVNIMNFQTYHFDRFDTSTHAHFYWTLTHWMAHTFPSHRKEIRAIGEQLRHT